MKLANLFVLTVVALLVMVNVSEARRKHGSCGSSGSWGSCGSSGSSGSCGSSGSHGSCGSSGHYYHSCGSHGSYGSCGSSGGVVCTTPVYTAPVHTAPVHTQPTMNCPNGQCPLMSSSTPTGSINQAATSERGKIMINLPQDATLYLVGQKMTTTGSTRVFNIPELESGVTYTYEIKVEVVQQGKVIEVVHSEEVTRGSKVNLTFALNNNKLVVVNPKNTTDMNVVAR